MSSGVEWWEAALVAVGTLAAVFVGGIIRHSLYRGGMVERPKPQRADGNKPIMGAGR